MTSAATAILWESWMLTRWGFLSRLGIVLAFVLVASTVYETREAVTEADLDALRGVTFAIIALGAFLGLGVGGPQDGRPGFPHYLGFSRPVSTWLQVIIPMTYRTVFCTALYLIPILIVDLAYGMSALTISATLLMVPITLMTIATAWWTDKKGIGQLIGWVAVWGCISALFYYTLHFNQHTLSEDTRSQWQWSFSFSQQDYLILLSVSVAAVVLTLAGVERQRHGDHGFDFWPLRDSSAQQTDAGWLTELYQTECPTTSAKQAQLWSEINGHGLPAIVWSLVAAVTIPMLWFLSNLLDSQILWGVVTATVVHIPLIMGTPNYGIRMLPGSAYVSTFDATRPLTTAWIAGVKLGVGTFGMTAGILVIAISFWFSAPLVDGFIVFVETIKLFIIDYVKTVPVAELTLWTLVALVQLSTIIAFLATTQALYALYGDRLSFTMLGLLVYPGIVIMMIATKLAPVSFAVANVWFATGMIAVGAIYFIHSVAKNRILSSGQIGVFVLIWILYALAYFYVLREGGLFESDTPAVFIVFRAGICLSSLTIFALAPWSLAMARHQ